MVLITKTMNDKIYFYNQDRQWVRDKKKANLYQSEEIALNEINNTSSLKDMYDNKKVAIVDYHEGIGVDTFDDDAKADEAFQLLNLAVKLYGEAVKNIDSLRTYYSEVLMIEDNRTQDLLHKIEFCDNSECSYEDLGKMLHNSRNARREAKDRLTYLAAITTSPLKLLDAHNTHYKGLYNRYYTPRTNPELFN